MTHTDDLKTVPLGDLFATWKEKAKPSRLTITAGRRRQRIYFDGTRIVLLDPCIAGRRRLGEILVSAGFVSDDDLTLALNEQKRSLRFLGEILIQQGKLQREALERVLLLQIEEELRDLFKSSFSLEWDACEMPEEALQNSMPIPLDDEMIACARRIDEWSVIKPRMPDLFGVFQCATDPATRPDVDAKVLTRLNGRRTLQSVADSLLMSPLEVARTVERLLEDGAARECTSEELLKNAGACIEAGQRSLAIALLERVQTGDGAAKSSEQIAELFQQLGNTRVAAQVRLGMARTALKSGNAEEAQSHLENAMKHGPASAELLQELVEVARTRGDEEVERNVLRKLVERTRNSDPKTAIASLERLLALTPEDYRARRLLVDLYKKSDRFDKAQEWAQKTIRYCAEREDHAELTEWYKELLTLDPSRGDIRRSLAKIQGSRKMKRMVKSAVAAGLLGALGGGLWLVRDRQEEEQVLDVVSTATTLMHQGKLDEARQALTRNAPDTDSEDVSRAAENVARRLAQKEEEKKRKERAARIAAFDMKFAEVQELVDENRFGTALETLNQLEQSTQDHEMLGRIRIRTRVLCENYVAVVKELREERSKFRVQSNPEKARAIHQDLVASSSDEVLAEVEQFRHLIEEKVPEGLEPELAWLNHAKTATKVHLDTVSLMREHAGLIDDYLKQREAVAQVTQQYAEAEDALADGKVDEALTGFREALAAHENGPLRGELSEKIETLEEVQEQLESLEEEVEGGKLEVAYQRAVEIHRNYGDVLGDEAVTIPVQIVSHPAGAELKVDGDLIGHTPLTMRLKPEESVMVHASFRGFEDRTLSLQPELGPQQNIKLRKTVRFRTQIPGSFAAPPTVYEGGIYTASRDGTVYRVAKGIAQPLKMFQTDSLSGTIARPLATPRGLLLTVLEGEISLLQTDGDIMNAAWQTKLNEELRLDPVLLGDLVLVVSEAGTIHALGLEDGSVRWTLPHAGQQLAGPPLVDGSRLFVTLRSGSVRIYEIADQSVVSEWHLGLDFATSMQRAGNLLLATTVRGELFAFDPETGKRKLLLDGLGLPSAPPLVRGPLVDLALGTRIVRYDLRTHEIVHQWGDDLIMVGAPVAMGDDLLVSNTDGSVHGLNLDASAPWFHTELADAPSVSGPVRLSDREIAVFFQDGTLCILD